MLSDQARSDANPILLIDENDNGWSRLLSARWIEDMYTS